MDKNPGEICKKKSIIILLISILHLELYSKLCTIEVDLSHLRNTSDIHTVGTGPGVYYKLYYDLVMLFGGTEIEAYLCWKEKVRFINFRKFAYCCCVAKRLTIPFFLYSFRVSRRGNVFFSLVFSLIVFLITLVGSMQESS